jgi:hypothetical protein
MANKITIEYVKNPEKAGKLTLVDRNGNTVLSKVPVSIPDNLPHVEGVVGARQLNVTSEENYQKDQQYNTLMGYIGAIGGAQRITSLSDCLFYGRNFQSDKLHQDENYFVLRKEDFEKIRNVIKQDASIVFNVKQVAFLWNPAKINPNDHQDLEARLHQLAGIKKHVDDLDRDVQKSLYESTHQGAGKTTGTNAIHKDAVNVYANKTATPVKQGQRRTNSYYNNQSTRYNDDSLDAFDIMFMYNYPNLAPFYRPNSMLAWMMYFNQNEVNEVTINNYINDNADFDGVSSRNFQYTPDGYQVQLIDNTGNVQGTLVCSNGQYTVENPNGQITMLNVDNNGRATGCLMDDGTPTINFDFVPQQDGYVGNWTATPSDGAAISAGIALDNDFAPTSTPYKTNDLDSLSSQYQFSVPGASEPTPDNTYQPQSPVVFEMPSSSPDNSYQPQATQDFDFGKPEPKWEPAPTPDADKTWENKNEDRYEPPPPPPPPPPKDDYSWGSSQDSYGNTTSFRM